MSLSDFHAMYQAQCQAEYEAWAEEQMEKRVMEHLHGETPWMEWLATKAEKALAKTEELVVETEYGTLRRFRFEAALALLRKRLPEYAGPGGWSIPINELVRQSVLGADLLMAELGMGMPKQGVGDGQQDPG